jgi:hypothetical protein
MLSKKLGFLFCLINSRHQSCGQRRLTTKQIKKHCLGAIANGFKPGDYLSKDVAANVIVVPNLAHTFGIVMLSSSFHKFVIT